MSFVMVKLKDIKPNPCRNEGSYVFNQTKIEALKDAIKDTTFWENILARKTKDGAIELAYGHHRIEALRQLVAEGETDYEEIRLNVRPETQLTYERMLKIFAHENSENWGEDPSNLCMTVLQVQAHLSSLLAASKTKDDFFKKVGDVGNIKMDDRSFTRAKNSGVGASLIAAFLGTTWSRQTIQDSLQVIEKDEATFKLAQNLPSVTLANRFQKLVTKKVSGKGAAKVVEMFDEATQRKVQDTILKQNLTRKEVEDAIKLTTDEKSDVAGDPIKAIKVVVENKKAGIKAAKDAADAEKPAPKEPVDKVLGHVQRLIDSAKKERAALTKNDTAKIVKAMGIVLGILENPAPVETSE